MEMFGYRKIFEDLDPYYPQPKDLNKLAAVMSGRSDITKNAISGNFANIVTSPSSEQIQTVPIPAGFTYLGQFIIHDISFDESSKLHKREDLPWEIACPQEVRKLRNLRNPTFDLETIYGNENPTDESTITRSSLIHDYQLPLLKLGVTEREIGKGKSSFRYPCDLPREKDNVKAEIVDERNDENLLLAQTQVAFTKFHNAIVVYLAQLDEFKDEQGNYKTKKLFDKARELTIRYYQKIVLTDYLPRFVQSDLLKDVESKAGSDELFYNPSAEDLFMPLEFAVAAFRFGHSMIRKDYNLNIENRHTSLGKMTAFTGRGKMRTNFEILAQRLNLPSIWIIDWNLFYELNGTNFNAAETINVELIFDLLILPSEIENNNDFRANSLAALDLYRGRRYGLPTGQDLAVKYQAEIILRTSEIGDVIKNRQIQGVSEEESNNIKQELISIFGEKTPLWFYILAEAEHRGDGKLGTVGSRIVAETIVQLIYHSEHSILRLPDWGNNEDFLLNKDDRSFSMKKMLLFIEEMNQKHRKMIYPEELYPMIAEIFDEINPLGNE